MKGRVTIAIPKTPPSLNTWLSSHWRVRDKQKKLWQFELNAELHRHGLPRCDRVEVEVVFRFRDRRKRDTGNYSSTLEKILGDALRPDFIPDDDSKRYWVRDARISPERGPAETLLIVDWEQYEEAVA